MDSIIIRPSDIWAPTFNNHSRYGSSQQDWFEDHGDLMKLANSLAMGWKQTIPMTLRIATKEEQKAIKEEIETTLKYFKDEDCEYEISQERGKIPFHSHHIYEALLSRYYPNGDYVAPKYIPIGFNRRTYALTFAMVIAKRLDLTSIFEIPALVAKYDNKLDEIKATFEENVIKKVGSRQLGIVDYLHLTMKVLASGGLDFDIRRLFSVIPGINGQKIARLAKLALRYGDLNIIELLKKGEINYVKLDKEKLQEIINSNMKPQDVYNILHEATPLTRPPKMAERRRILGIVENCPVDILRDYSRGIINNNIPDEIQKYTEHAQLINRMIVLALNTNTRTLAEVWVKDMEKGVYESSQ